MNKPLCIDAFTHDLMRLAQQTPLAIFIDDADRLGAADELMNWLQQLTEDPRGQMVVVIAVRKLERMMREMAESGRRNVRVMYERAFNADHIRAFLDLHGVDPLYLDRIVKMVEMEKFTIAEAVQIAEVFSKRETR